MLFLARADNAGQHLHLDRVALADEFRKLADFYEIAAEEREAGDAERTTADALPAARLRSRADRFVPAYLARSMACRRAATRRDR